MRDDFCAFILTHGRPDKLYTLNSIRKQGYTGKVFIVIDDEDETSNEYKRLYGDDILVFSKDEVGQYTDQFDNFSDKRAVLWARNVCWSLAKQQGYRFFIELDDDYYVWSYRMAGRHHRLAVTDDIEFHGWKVGNLDAIYLAMVKLLETTSVATIAWSQGGDHIGGHSARISKRRFLRKAMNTFVCDTQKPFYFKGRINEDVNTYVSLGSIGRLFFTDLNLQMDQTSTQQNAGGMTELYLDSGTYVKSFYSVMCHPSAVKIKAMQGNKAKRLHHEVNWSKVVPLILSEDYKKRKATEMS